MALLPEIFRSFTRLIYPRLCPVCGAKLVDREFPICAPCLWEIPATGNWSEPWNEMFTRLQIRIPNLEKATALFYFHHESPYRHLIHQIKYQGRRDLGRSLGAYFGRELAESGQFGNIDLLVPVPLHWSKRLKRGYNQSEEICTGIGQTLGIPVDTRLVKRIRATRSQTTFRSADGREKNVTDAFTVPGDSAFRHRHIALVDDVLTSGSTISACARAISSAYPDVRLSVITLAVVRRWEKYGKLPEKS